MRLSTLYEAYDTGGITYDKAIDEAMRLIHNQGLNRGLAISRSAKMHGIPTKKLAQEMNKRSQVRKAALKKSAVAKAEVETGTKKNKQLSLF